MLNCQQLDCYQLALTIASSLPDLTSQWTAQYAYLKDQIMRSTASILLNISEGCGRRTVRDRQHFFSIARGSAMEAAAVIDIAVAYQLIPQSTGNEMNNSLTRIVKMTYKLR